MGLAGKCIVFLIASISIFLYQSSFGGKKFEAGITSTGNHDRDLCFSELKCDEQGMSCLVSRLYSDSEGKFYLKMNQQRTDHCRHAGLFGHLGIGEPSAYFYIDCWTLLGTKAFLKQSVRDGYRKIVSEKAAYPRAKFVPVYIAANVPDVEYASVGGLTMIVQSLWQLNFFRRLYIGAASLTTCQYWFSSQYCNPTNLNILHYEEENNPFVLGAPITDHRNKLFEFAIIGISKKVLLPEQDILMVDNYNLSLMSAGYKSFATLLQSGIQCPESAAKRSVFAYRLGNRRRILNWQDLTKSFHLTPVIFETYSFHEQVCIASSSQLLVAAHGAALSHLFFLPKSSSTIELFPCNFRKTIYRNLALVLGRPYKWWQAGNPSDCPHLPTKPLDWYSQDSKNSHRDQSYRVDLMEFKKVHDFTGNEQYLLYMPYEQFNNQLISLRCACGIAALLNRTLVVPELGYYNAAVPSAPARRVYEPRDFVWQPISRYLNTTLLYGDLPCKTAPFSAYYGQVRTIDRIYFRRLGARFNQRKQPESYYYFVSGLHYMHHRSLPYSIPVYNNASSIIKYFSDYSRSLRHLALGNVFWMYTFEAPLEYPQTRYVDIYSEGSGSMYKRISSAIQFHDLLDVASDVQYYGAVHWRRGDYAEKCKEELLPFSCYPTARALAAAVARIDPLRRLPWIVLSNGNTTAVNRKLSKWGFKTLISGPCGHADPIECAIKDQRVAIKATVFIGNMYSSFTRTISDKRLEVGKATDLF